MGKAWKQGGQKTSSQNVNIKAQNTCHAGWHDDTHSAHLYKAPPSLTQLLLTTAQVCHDCGCSIGEAREQHRIDKVESGSGGCGARSLKPRAALAERCYTLLRVSEGAAEEAPRLAPRTGPRSRSESREGGPS